MIFFKKLKTHIRIKKRLKFVNKIFAEQTLEEYQKYDMLKLLDCINTNFNTPNTISCLDIGASANEINFISNYVKSVTGINISENYLKSDYLHKNAKIMIMDGRQLDFPDSSFDFVYSINLFEHIHDIGNSIDEQLRVVNKDGYCFATWYPTWSSSKGHHVMEAMVKNWEKEASIETQNYVNNGSIIEDWGHLLYTKVEMQNKLSKVLKNEKITHIINNFIYDSQELNRLFFDDFLKILQSKKLEIITIKKQQEIPPKGIQEKLEKLHGKKDFSTQGCEIIFKKI